MKFVSRTLNYFQTASLLNDENGAAKKYLICSECMGHYRDQSFCTLFLSTLRAY
jgi:hypothetical protein